MIRSVQLDSAQFDIMTSLSLSPSLPFIKGVQNLWTFDGQSRPGNYSEQQLFIAIDDVAMQAHSGKSRQHLRYESLGWPANNGETGLAMGYDHGYMRR